MVTQTTPQDRTVTEALELPTFLSDILKSHGSQHHSCVIAAAIWPLYFCLWVIFTRYIHNSVSVTIAPRT